MSADVGMDWDALLQQSEELAAGVRAGRQRKDGERCFSTSATQSIEKRMPVHSITSPGHLSAPSLFISLSPRQTHDFDLALPFREKNNTGKTLQDSAAAAAFPRVERDLLQVEAYASALRARLARADGRGDAAAAARLLAHEGVNTRK